MPTLSRFILALILFAAILWAVVFVLANFVQPTPRDITVRVPTDKLMRE